MTCKNNFGCTDTVATDGEDLWAAEKAEPLSNVITVSGLVPIDGMESNPCFLVSWFESGDDKTLKREDELVL